MQDACRNIILSCPCVFSRPGTLCTIKKTNKKKRQSLRERCKQRKKGLFSCLYHMLLKPLRVASTLNIIIRPYLNFNVVQVKGVWIGLGYLYFEVQSIGAATGTDDLSKIAKIPAVFLFNLHFHYTTGWEQIWRLSGCLKMTNAVPLSELFWQVWRNRKDLANKKN